jgi:hypothetical protein
VYKYVNRYVLMYTYTVHTYMHKHTRMFMSVDVCVSAGDRNGVSEQLEIYTRELEMQ